ncbi:hypothetical protein HOBO_248 [Bacillus phage Hobo]|uniref:Uncharacterized protein n=2 Tax=Caeruleovirus BM15 TaxID=1985178 RepID=A0A0S2MUY5_9CAUD|nr:hypothetical protein FD732_gp093 [Bacillus phage BM15]ALO79656.1 hypothetical protein BM10_252 [Bacillus phage BM15]AXQ67003.1 hypothetical protein HOBO_248 [Bacillus phage Hobo]
MKLAKELWKLATSKLGTNSEGYIEQVRREARKAANKSHMQVEVRLPDEARNLKYAIADALYEDGFNVSTKEYTRLCVFYVTVDWQDKKLKKPVHDINPY